jgi:hypothetical protein
MMVALVSTRGSPGASVSALALTLAAPDRCLLAECDPAGGDVLAGYLQGTLPAQRGLAPLAVAELRGRLADEFDRQLVDLAAPRRRLLLPGVSDPAQAVTVASVWTPIADHLHRLGRDGWLVLVDCGRPTTGHFGWPLLHRADLVLLVVRGTLASVSAAVPVLRALRLQLAGGHPRSGPVPMAGGPPPAAGPAAGRLALLVVEVGPYHAGDIARSLGLDVAATLPADARTALRLATGGALQPRSPLLRAAAAVRLAVDVDRPAPGPPEAARAV